MLTVSKLAYKMDVYNKLHISLQRITSVTWFLAAFRPPSLPDTSTSRHFKGRGFKQPSSAGHEMDVRSRIVTGRIQMFGFVPRRCCERATTGGCKALHVERFPVYTFWDLLRSRKFTVDTRGRDTSKNNWMSFL